MPTTLISLVGGDDSYLYRKHLGNISSHLLAIWCLRACRGCTKLLWQQPNVRKICNNASANVYPNMCIKCQSGPGHILLPRHRWHGWANWLLYAAACNLFHLKCIYWQYALCIMQLLDERVFSHSNTDQSVWKWEEANFFQLNVPYCNALFSRWLLPLLINFSLDIWNAVKWFVDPSKRYSRKRYCDCQFLGDFLDMWKSPPSLFPSTRPPYAILPPKLPLCSKKVSRTSKPKSSNEAI